MKWVPVLWPPDWTTGGSPSDAHTNNRAAYYIRQHVERILPICAALRFSAAAAVAVVG